MPHGSDVTSTGQLIVERRGALATIILNRPEALNALSLEMISGMRRLLDRLEVDPEVGYVAVKGAGERALCAGGDIRRLYRSALDGDDWAETMWSEEYALNARIAGFSKPYIAFMSGIVMGGGIGVSAHGSHRIVTCSTKVAMPEVGIGLIPDVGGTWLLSRAPGETGTCLALTGMTIGAGDAIYAGLADHYVASDRLDSLRDEIARLDTNEGAAKLDALIAKHASQPPSSQLEAHRGLIDRCFGADTVETIEENLKRSDEPYAQELLKTMLSKSPTSLKVTLELLKLARSSSRLEECLEREFNAVLHATRIKGDMIEGIRAAVIDKDRNPKWRPSRLEEVSDSVLTPFLEGQPRRAIPFYNREPQS